MPAHLPPNCSHRSPHRAPILRSPGDNAFIVGATGTYRPKSGSPRRRHPSPSPRSADHGYEVASTATGRRPAPARLASRGPCGLVAGASPETRAVCSPYGRGPSRPRARVRSVRLTAHASVLKTPLASGVGDVRLAVEYISDPSKRSGPGSGRPQGELAHGDVFDPAGGEDATH